MTVAAATVPNRTVAPVRPVPVTVTVVPPEVGPVFGVTAVTVDGGGHAGEDGAVHVTGHTEVPCRTGHIPDHRGSVDVTDVHTGLASPGSVVIRTFPALSVAAQCRVAAETGHPLTRVGSRHLPGTRSPPPAAAEASSWPLPLPATKMNGTGATKLIRRTSGATGPFFHEDAPPVGLVELSTLPAWSPATHRVADGHEIAQMRMFASTSLRLHAAVPPAGQLRSEFPRCRPTATHAVLEAQETPHTGVGSVDVGPGPCAGSPVGSVDVQDSPTRPWPRKEKPMGQEDLIGSASRVDGGPGPRRRSPRRVWWS